MKPRGRVDRAPLFRRLIAAVVPLFIATGLSAQEPRVVAIVGATVIHPEHELPQAAAPDTTIIISGNRIHAVGSTSSVAVPPDAHVIDAHGKWVIPGLIDAHVHFFQSGNYYARPDIIDLTAVVSFAQETARNKTRLPVTFKTWIASGVTSVVDVGGPMWNFEVRDLARRTPEAPRVAVAGPLVSMVARPQFDLGDPPIVKVDTPEQARELVARELPFKPDYIKVWFIHQPGDDLAKQEEIVKAAGNAAHAAGVRLAVHATELEVAKAALRAGADFLVHSVEDRAVDEEFLHLVRKRGTLYCPTLFVLEGYGLALSNRWMPTEAEKRLADPQILAAMRDLNRIPEELLPSWVRRLIRERAGVRTSRAASDNLRRVWDAGIPVVMGSDAGNIGTLHGPAVFREMKLMVDSGLTALEVLRASTTNGAKAMRLEGQVGQIAPGRFADLAIVNADPLVDIDNVSRVYRVIKDGQVFDPDALIDSVR